MTRSDFVLVAAFLTLIPLPAQQPAKEPTKEFRVHEWGTFTTVQGSDGVTLLGAHHEEEVLPPFVHGYDRIHRSGFGLKGLSVPLRGVTQKMETPVIYVHASTPLRLKVEVEFKDGLTSQWYPQVQELVPASIAKEPPSFDLAEVKRSKIAWDVEVIPEWEKVAAAAPRVAGDDPWNFAREVSAAGLRVAAGNGVGQTERYLFYRGLGRFALPRRVEATRGGVVELVNASDEAVPSALALEVGPGTARYRFLDAIGARATGACELGALPLRPLDEVVEELQRDVERRMLVPAGLHADEARAMVRTWARSWFRKPGTRVLYVVPRKEVDAILPLTITPKPAELVRVLLGRIEYFTPEVEQELASALTAYAASGFRDTGTLDKSRLRLDRFLEPALRRMAASKATPELELAATTALRVLLGI